MHTQRVVQSARVRRASRKPVAVTRTNRKPGSRWRTAAVLMSLGCVAASANAESFFQLEAGVGFADYTKTGNGIYYDEGFSNKTPTTFPAFRAGVVLTPIDARPRSWVPGLRLHLDYLYFGRLSWDAQAPQDAGDFTARGLVGGYDPVSKTCLNNECGQMSDFRSSGQIQALALTAEPYWDIGGGWTLGVEAGPAIYRTTWTTDAVVETDGWKLGPPGTVHVLTTSPALHVGALVGASVSKGHFSLRYNYIYAPIHYGSTDSESPAGVKGAHMLSVNYTW